MKLGEEEDLFSKMLSLERQRGIFQWFFSHYPKDKEHILSVFTVWAIQLGTQPTKRHVSYYDQRHNTCTCTQYLSAHFFPQSAIYSAVKGLP